jgi:hypothetical protein
MIRKYTFDYDCTADARFTVDTAIFTIERAKEVLESFAWDYDSDGDLINECMKKYAMECIFCATSNSINEIGVISEFNNKEGFFPIDGSCGILLTSVSAYDFDESQLDMKIN